MTTVLWFHCFSGIAGDMALGALVDLGADLDEVRALCERLPLAGWALDAEATLRGGIAATHVRVHAEETSVVRTYAHIAAMVEEARLPEPVRERALRTFGALAAAEGKLHRRPPEQVHFHEVGAIDAIIDVVGTAAAVHVLDVDEVRTSPIANGMGMTRAAHGALPVPAPAVVELLRGLPTYGVDLPVELTTPTGAALVAAIANGSGPMPSMQVRAIGFGAGTREIDGRPNVLQAVLGDLLEASPSGQPVMLLEVNVDDATGETIADAVTALLECGAHDAWVTPIVMKKGRPAYTVAALCDPSFAAEVARVLTRETGSLGVRGTMLERWPASRSEGEVEVAGFPVRVKVSPGRVKVEHDDAARIARRVGLPVREVISLAEEAARRGHGVARLPDPSEEPDGPGDDTA